MKFKILIFLSAIAIAACKQQPKKAFPTIPGYDLNAPIVIKLKSELDEISGVYYYPKDTSVFAINDEAGLLYKIYIRNKIQMDKWKFDKSGDFEDLSLVDSTFYVLHSDGDIVYFKVLSKDSVVADKTKFFQKEKNEFEIMYHDEESNNLVLICKDCKTDNNNSVTAYAFDPVTKEFAKTPFFTIDATDITTKLQGDKNRFKPSAAAINPVTKELYIVSSVNKALVIASRTGKVKSVTPLDPVLFKQPEGLTFTPTGDLIISNEFADVDASTILIFKVKAPLK